MCNMCDAEHKVPYEIENPQPINQAQQLLDCLVASHGAILGAISHEDGLDALDGDIVLDMLEYQLFKHKIDFNSRAKRGKQKAI